MHCILDDSSVLRAISPNLEKGPWIAGGTAMSWFLGQSVGASDDDIDFSLLQDIDVFCANAEQLKTVRQALTNANRSVDRPFVTKNAETYKFKSFSCRTWKIQLITCNFFDSAESLINSFDFVCCGIATDGRKFVMLPGAGKDIISKTLRINCYNPNTILSRTLKYWSMGWTPTTKLVEKISNDLTIETMLSGKGGEYDHAF